MMRQRIVFYGWVQGVGFRYHAVHAANTYGATGWVRNNLDDTVTMEIQGSREQINQVISAVKSGRFIQIDRMDVTDIPDEESERGFRTRW